MDEELIRLCFPPRDRPDLPNVITRQLWKRGAIKRTISEILSHPEVDTLVATAPFISTYFVSFLSRTKLKNLVLLINRDAYNPDYVNNAVSALKNAPFHVLIRQRPEKSGFMHLKIMIPFIKQHPRPGMKVDLIPFCAMAGSVNFTKNGIELNDEGLYIFKDQYSINAFNKTYADLLEGSVLVYDSSMPSTGKSPAPRKVSPP